MMCKAFSGIVMEDGRVLWKLGLDSHADILEEFGIADNTLPPRFAKVEIAPQNGDYLSPDEWAFRLDEDTAPTWWTPTHEQFAWGAFKTWKLKLDRVLIRKPIIRPFRDVTPPKKITKRHLDLLKEWASVWASVRASVGASVWDSVGASVGDSVGDSVGASVWDSVGASVGDSVWDSVGDSVVDSVWDSVEASVGDSVRAYCGSFFHLPRKAWKYTENIKTKGYPFQPLADLWNMGLVPSFNGTTWQLHGGRDGTVLWQGRLDSGASA
ncbi:MAG: hypothetical protein PHV11_09880 [Candidatus Bipolaricaulis sp.]|nr:hypothetical protein [Candidatus Bipolaricaulis sp.]